MLALSIRQPWAYAILHLGKDIENRDRRFKYRGKFLIHASKTIEWHDVEYLRRKCFKLPDKFLVGGIVGTAEIIDCVDKSNSEWFVGDYGLVLKNATALPFYPVRGMPGFFNVEYDLE